jgi:hypothetical protein
MATLGSYYIDSTDFLSATAVYTDVDLTIAAPAGYYQSCGIYRQQTILPSGPVLGAPITCPYCDNGECAVTPADGWLGEQQGVVDLDITIGTGIGVYHVSFTPLNIPNGIFIDYDAVTYGGGSSSNFGWLAGPYYGNSADAAAWGFPAVSPYQLSNLVWSGNENGSDVGIDFVPTGSSEPIAVIPADFSGTAGNPGTINLFIPKPLAEPQVATIRIVGCVGLDSDAWTLSNRCAGPLTSFLITTPQVSAIAACGAIPAWFGSYWNGPVNGTLGEPGLYDIMYANPTATVTLAAGVGVGFYGYESALGVQGYFEIDANSVIVTIGSCPP